MAFLAKETDPYIAKVWNKTQSCKKKNFNIQTLLNVWSLVCSVAAFMLSSNVPKNTKAVCLFLWDVYLGSHKGLSQTSLWCALRSIPAYWGHTLLGSSWSAWFLYDSPPDLKEQCQASLISHSLKICALIQQISNFLQTSRCVCVVRVSLQSSVTVLIVVKFDGSSPWVWKENKSHQGKSDLQHNAFIKSWKKRTRC